MAGIYWIKGDIKGVSIESVNAVCMIGEDSVLFGKQTVIQNLESRVFIKECPWNQHLFRKKKEVRRAEGEVKLQRKPSASLSWPQEDLWS